MLVDANEANNSISKTDKNAKSLGTRLASGIKTAAKWGAALTAAAAGVTTAFIRATKKIAENGDAIQKNSQKVGLSYKSYQEWDYVMTRCGTSINDCTTGLKTLTNKLDDARKGSKGATETFNRLGISVDSLNGLSREQVFKKMVTALQNVKDETEKAALANDLFGKSGQNLMPMFNMTEAETSELIEKFTALGGVMSDEAVEASAAFMDALTDIQTAFNGLKTRLGSEFLPGFTSIMTGISNVLAGNGEVGVEEIKTGLDEVEGAFAKLKENLGPILKDIWDSIIAALFSAENVAAMVRGAGDLVYGLLDGLLGTSEGEDAQNTSQQVGRNIADGIIAGLKDTLLNHDWFEIIATMLDNLSFGGNTLFSGKFGTMLDYAKMFYLKYKANKYSKNHASGLPYVPYDGYTATLHRGERVLPAGQAEKYTDNTEVIAAIDNLANSIYSMGIYVDGNTLVGAISGNVDNQLGRMVTTSSRLSLA